jgi:hypothetical protein
VVLEGFRRPHDWPLQHVVSDDKDQEKKNSTINGFRALKNKCFLCTLSNIRFLAHEELGDGGEVGLLRLAAQGQGGWRSAQDQELCGPTREGGG